MERILIRSQDLLQGIPAEVSDHQIGEGYTAVVLSIDAQATVEALQAIIKQMGEQACVLAKDGMAAKAQVEALQRERGHAKNMAAVQKEVADNQTWHVRELTAALDDEREKRLTLERITQEDVDTIATLQAQLAGLKRNAGLDCGDQSCLYAVEHTGMRTNGGCRCDPKRMKDDLVRSRKACDALQAQLESANVLIYKKNCALGRADTTITDLQAQLRQVEGERAKWEDIAGLRFAGDHKFVKEMELLKIEHAKLRQLVEALPVPRGKVVVHPPCVGMIEGTYDVRIEWQEGNSFKSIRTAQFHVKENAEALAALLTYRATQDASTRCEP